MEPFAVLVVLGVLPFDASQLHHHHHKHDQVDQEDHTEVGHHGHIVGYIVLQPAAEKKQAHNGLKKSPSTSIK